MRRAPPDIVEDVDGELFRGFPVSHDSHDQREDEAMSPLVERMQRELVARSNRLDERCPVLLRDRSLGLGIEDVAKCCRLLLCTFLGLIDRFSHGPELRPILRRSRSAEEDTCFPGGFPRFRLRQYHKRQKRERHSEAPRKTGV